jgi:GAF domain-containing protein
MILTSARLSMLTPDDEQRRQAALDALGLDGFETTAFDDLTRMAAEVFETTMASISIVDRDRKWLKAQVGLTGLEGGPRETSFSAHAIEHPKEVLVVEDATQDERFKTNPFVTETPHIRFYAAAPLTLSSGHAIGALCVMDTTPRKIAADKLEQLKFLADQVIQTLEERRRGKPA